MVDRHSYSKSMDVENVYAIQQYQGIEIFNSVSSFAVKNGQVLNANLSFSDNISQKVNTTSPALNASTAINKAAQALGLSNPTNLDIVETISGNSMIFSNVRVNSFSTVENSVILPEVVIGRNCEINKAIVEKGCLIPEGTIIGKERAEDEKRFHVSSGGVILVTPDMLGQERHLVR